jgi:hypothetical protein
MILMCVSTELSCHGVLETVDDLIVVRTPVFVTQIVSSGNVSYDVNLEKIMHKIYSSRLRNLNYTTVLFTLSKFLWSQ